jgi:hypothetical protein
MMHHEKASQRANDEKVAYYTSFSALDTFCLLLYEIFMFATHSPTYAMYVLRNLEI